MFTTRFGHLQKVHSAPTDMRVVGEWCAYHSAKRRVSLRGLVAGGFPLASPAAPAAFGALPASPLPASALPIT